MTDQESKPTAHASPPEGRIARYELVEALGKGAMGVVYHAYDPLLDRDVALKLMLPQIANEPDQKYRFEREARAVAKLMHPNVVTLFDLGYHTDGSPYIALELLKGHDLLHAMRQGPPLTLEQKVSVVVQVLDGLAHAHQAGIVHRDIKPANIFLTQDGTVKIMDFGVARFTSVAATGTGAVVGTVEYMSPEQVQGLHVDGRSDLFSTACVLVELLTGRRPFHADSLVAILYKIANEQPVVGLPAGREHDLLRPILMRALARQPEERFQTAADFAAELRAALRGIEESAGAEAAAAAGVAERTAADVTPTAAQAATAPQATVHAPPPVPPAPLPPPARQPRPGPAIDPFELFRLMCDIYVGGKSGHLHFTHGLARRSLRFVGGHIVMATTDVPGEYLGNVLVRFGLVTQAQLDHATEILLRDRKRLGTVLDEMGLVPRERIGDAVALHVRELLFSVIENGGSYAFEETSVEAIAASDLTTRIAPGEVILEATRRIQDPRAIRRAMGDMDRKLIRSTHPVLRMQKIPLTPTDGFLLSRIDGTLSANEVFQLIPLPLEDVERSLFGLLCTGAVEHLPDTVPGRLPASGGMTRTVLRPSAPLPAITPPAPPAAGASAAGGQRPAVPAAEPPRERPLSGSVPPLPAAGSTPPASTPGTGRLRPPTDASEAGRVLHVEKTQEQAQAAAEEIRRQVMDTYQGLRSKDHFELLGIGRNATVTQVKEAYFRMARPFHPDAYRDLPLEDLKDMRAAVFIRLGEAYDTLRNPESRARYERQYMPRATSFRPPPTVVTAPPEPSATTVTAGPPAPPPVAQPAPPPPDPAEVHASAVKQAAQDIRRAEALVHEGKYWDAIQLLEPVIGIVSKPLEVKTRVLLGRCYMKNPNWLKRAADQLQKAIEMDPGNGEAYLVLGSLYRASNLPQRSIAMYRKAHELMPGNEEAVRELHALGAGPDEGPASPPRRRLFSRG